ncbi:MAG: hypothetical protein ACD_68C00025G0002 [uncultured bacterium]|nr:MAG: hypothetical protein ACD_68C00025G0002 [uncultured bacterium]
MKIKTNLNIKIIVWLVVIITIFFGLPNLASAEQLLYSHTFDQNSLSQLNYLTSDGGRIVIRLNPATFTQNLLAEIKIIDEGRTEFSGYRRITDIYRFSFSGMGEWPKRPIIILLPHQDEIATPKFIGLWNSGTQKWQKMDSINLTYRRAARLSTMLPFATIAVFEKINNDDFTFNAAASAPSISAKAGIVIEERTKTVLFEKESGKSLAQASLTKLATARNFLKHKSNLSELVSYSYLDNIGGATVPFINNDRLLMRDLFFASLVASANNATRSLERLSGLSDANYLAELNNHAKYLGLTETVFRDITGLNPGNQTTALEMAILASDSLKPLAMLQATTTHQYAAFGQSTGRIYSFRNTNEILNSPHYYITGSKTGYLPDGSYGGDGYNLMMRVRYQTGKEIIGVVLGSPTRDQSYQDVQNILNYSLNGLK